MTTANRARQRNPIKSNRKSQRGPAGLAAVAATVAVVVVISLLASDRVQAADPGVTLQVATGDTLQIDVAGRITGLTWVGSDTLAVLTSLSGSATASGDREVHLIYQNPVGVVVRREDFTGVLNRGLAWDGEYLWSCGDNDEGRSLLYKIEPDTLKVEEAYDTPGHRPSSLCWDGRFVWITDRDSGRADRFDPEVEEITRSVVTPGFSPFGIAWDGTYMWLTDSGTGRLYRLAGGRRRWSATADADQFLFRGDDIRLLFDGRNLRYLPPGRNQAIQLVFH